MLLTSSISLFLRFVSLSIKFFFLIFIFKILSIDDAGKYAFLTSIIIFSIQFIGFDFYMHSHRKIISTNDNKIISKFISRQFSFYLCMYFIYIIFFFCFNLYFNFEINLFLFLFICLIFSEHIAIEISRLFIALEKNIFSNLIFFVQSGFWMILIILNYFCEIFDTNLQSIIYFWLLGNFLALFLSYYFFSLIDLKMNISFIFFRFKNFKKAISYSIYFAVATIAAKGIDLIDRYMITYYLDFEDLGELAFAMNVGSILQTFASIGIISIFFKKLGYYFNKDKLIYKKLIIKVFYYLVVSMIVLIPILYYSYPLIASFTDKEELINNSYLFFTVLIYYAIFIFCMFFYLPIFFKHEDAYNMHMFLITFLINLFLNIFLIPHFGIIGSIYSSIIAFLFLLCSRLFKIFILR